MKVSTIEHDFPYLAARGDNTGSFLEWLKELSVPGSRDVQIADIIRWGWIQPSFRVLLPDGYFLSWADFPSHSGEPHELENDDDVCADHLWWSARAGAKFLFGQLPFTGAWFVHPFDRSENRYSARVLEARQATALPPSNAKQHPNGRTYQPWIDYFPYWKAYELIDVLPTVRVTGPIWLTDRIPEKLDEIKENLPTLVRWRTEGLARVHKTWQEFRTIFYYLASYRTMRAALMDAPQTATVQPWTLQAAAVALANIHQLTTARLEELTTTQLLAQARAWKQWEEQDGSGPGKQALGHLQKDILCAIEWLYYLTGKTYDDYADQWTAPSDQPRQRLALSTALPVESRRAEESFLDHFRVFRATYDMIPPSDQLTEREVATVVRSLRHRTYLFADWLKRYQTLHDALKGPPSWDWAGVTDHHLFDDLTLMVLLTEKVLLGLANPDAAPAGTYPDFKPLMKLSTNRLEAADPRFRGAWELASTHWNAYTSLKKNPPDPFGALRALTVSGPPTPAALAKALLFFGLARNYFAHHSYKHHTLIQTPDGGALVAGIVTATLYLSAPALKLASGSKSSATVSES